MDALTPTEQRIVSLCREGKSAKQIAESISRAPGTVCNMLTRLARKLNLEPGRGLLMRIALWREKPAC